MAVRLRLPDAIIDALKDEQEPDLIHWYNNLHIMTRWPSFTMEYLEYIRKEDPSQYFFICGVHTNLQKKEKSEHDKLVAEMHRKAGRR